MLGHFSLTPWSTWLLYLEKPLPQDSSRESIYIHVYVHSYIHTYTCIHTDVLYTCQNIHGNHTCIMNKRRENYL